MGIHLDGKLSWGKHIEYVLDKATSALWACRVFFSRTWGLSPTIVYWLYTTVIRPTVTYGALVWRRAAQERTNMTKLQKLQRLACLGITDAPRTCLMATLGRLVNLTPLHIIVQKEALSTAINMHVTGRIRKYDRLRHMGVSEEIPETSMVPIL